MKTIRFAVVFACLIGAGTRPAVAQFENVGSIDFPTSETGRAQQHFLRGVAILHSFGWNQAIEQFQAAQELSPDFALAYWGESLSYNHPLNSQMDPEEPRKVLERLGATREERLAKAPTDREKGFLQAVEVLWGEGDQEVRRVGHMEAMRDLYERYPEDPEVAAFYALSMLGAVQATGDLSQRLNVRAGAITLGLLAGNRNHPGAAHYTIHAFDDPLHAPLALEAADLFADIAPAVSHARHMPTHIFIQHGMWDRVSGNNQSAYDAARELWRPGDAMAAATHALDWGQYGDLQLGDYAKARLWIERIESMAAGGFLEGGPRQERGDDRAVNTVALLKSRYVVETEEWSIASVTGEATANELLATALSAYRLGNHEVLAGVEEELRERGGSGNAAVVRNEVSALLHASQGHIEPASRFMDDASATVEAAAPPRGAASPIKPVHELYGEILLDLGRPDEAIEKFETSLLRMPRRVRSLLGLARASAAAGESGRAIEAYGELMRVWSGRTSFDGYREAEHYLETHGGA